VNIHEILVEKYGEFTETAFIVRAEKWCGDFGIVDLGIVDLGIVDLGIVDFNLKSYNLKSFNLKSFKP
jgi:hypothetical protein